MKDLRNSMDPSFLLKQCGAIITRTCSASMTAQRNWETLETRHIESTSLDLSITILLMDTLTVRIQIPSHDSGNVNQSYSGS